MTAAASKVVSLKTESQSPLSPAQQEAIATHKQRKAKRATIPRITLGNRGKGGVMNFDGISSHDGYHLLMEALGIPDEQILYGYMGELITGLSHDGRFQEQTFNFIIQFIASMEPKDTAEALLFAQMAVTHLATIQFSSGVIFKVPVDRQRAEWTERAFNRLARTYAAQMQTLKLYRSTGKQRITVKHVTVNEGGQAIVGDVNAGGGTSKKGEPAS